MAPEIRLGCWLLLVFAVVTMSFFSGNATWYVLRKQPRLIRWLCAALLPACLTLALCAFFSCYLVLTVGTVGTGLFGYGLREGDGNFHLAALENREKAGSLDCEGREDLAWFRREVCLSFRQGCNLSSVMALSLLAVMLLPLGAINLANPAAQISLADIERVEKDLIGVGAIDPTAAQSDGSKAARESLRQARDSFASAQYEDARRHLECALVNVIIVKNGGAATSEQIKSGLSRQ